MISCHLLEPWHCADLGENKAPGQGSDKSHCDRGVCPPKGLCGDSVPAQAFCCIVSAAWRETCLRRGDGRVKVFPGLRVLDSTPPPLETSKAPGFNLFHSVSFFFFFQPFLLQRLPYTRNNGALIKSTQLGRQDVKVGCGVGLPTAATTELQGQLLWPLSVWLQHG